MIDRVVRTTFASAVVAADTLVLATAAMAAGAALGPTHDLVSRIYRDFARVALLGCGARLVCVGEEQLEAERPYVLVSNHQSHLDSMAILASLPRHGVRFVAKEELGRIPLFGHALRATGSVFVARTDTRADVGRLDERGAALVKRVCVVFFAEGTRSTDGRLHPFKKGAAAFALKNRMPLVPIGVHGSYEILPPGWEVKRSGTVAVSIGKPIETAGRNLDERESLTETLRSCVAERIAEARELVESR